jgi:hypothetical protein
MLIVLETLS